MKGGDNMLVTLNKGYKFKIKPNNEQREFFLKSFGCARKIYNLYVNELYTKLESINYQNGLIKKSDLHLSKYTEFTKMYTWLKEVDSQCLSSAKMDFNTALDKFNKEYDKKSYTKRSKKREKTLDIKPTFKDLKGMPKFKSIKKNDFSYRTYNQSCNGKWSYIKLENKQLKIPKLKTTIKVVQHRELPPNSIIKNCTISMDNLGVFYCSLCVEYTKEIEYVPSSKVLGLDYSSHDFYYSSEGKTANYPRYYKKSEDKLKKEQRRLSHKVKDSNNWKEQKRKVAKLQKKIANQRLDWLHKESRKLCNKYDAIIFEDIDLRSIGQCLTLGKSTYDNGFGMFRQFCKYKLEEQGKQFIKIDKWYPSSKKCSCCGYIKKNLKLSDRTYICEECGLVIDRDYNASLNIKEAGTSLLAW